ncbi:hypothetical protein DDP54_07745 [Cellulomonas sp. WB94]|nr:hypothetical protein DDP54_07745 [Cellulomonas sp. WB94]
MTTPIRATWLEPRSDVRAFIVPRPGPDGGSAPRDRAGRVKSNRVDLVAATEHDAWERPGGVSDADWAWMLAAGTRRWRSVVERFGDQAAGLTLDLVAAGVVTVRVHPTGPTFVWDAVQKWTLTPGPANEGAQRTRERGARHDDLRERASQLAGALEVEHHDLADVLLSTPPHSPLLAIAVAAASDLLTGVSHDGPRAFSQTHFGHTKARDDAPDLLRRAGVSERTLRDLGLARSPYVGLGGAIDVNGLPIGAAFAGPVRLRATQQDPLIVQVHERARAVLLVENLQAAETACDAFPNIAVVWFAGQPADAVLAVCVMAATQTNGPIIVTPDADLGGVRIADRLLTALPASSIVHLVDVGVGTSAPTTAFSVASLDELNRIGGAAHGPHAAHLTAFALAVAERGFPVEQEAPIRAALSVAIAGLPGGE